MNLLTKQKYTHIHINRKQLMVTSGYQREKE